MATSDVTSLLDEPVRSDPRTVDRLFAVVYDELRRLAANYLASERPDHTLQPNALVHEAYMKLVNQSRVDWRGRTHFFAVAAQAMQRILIDHARAKGRAKRGGGWERVSLSGTKILTGRPETRMVALADALERLTVEDRQQARIVYLRYFGGLTIKEVAEVLGISVRAVERDWTHAKAWLRRELSDNGTSTDGRRRRKA